ncbi:MAG: Flp pilus assembly complex ATPase component TadA, partial [Candidatus Eremiobacteraeota bacterium]|nr:Flp pilus assembly complex ATPase component TadA [Candidatus Eremiobacteraeota bacterium]
MSASVITIIGAKGGVGSTTLSYELAQALSKRGRIALVDGDFGGRRTIALLTNCVKELDEARDESNNLSFVTLRDGITAVELAHNIHAGFTLKPEKVEALVQNFAQTGTSAIVDAPQPFAAAIRPFIVRCAKFFLVVEPTLLGLAGGKAMMAELQKFGISISQIAAVSVQRDAHSEFAKNDIERALGVKLAAEIPPKSDRRYARAVEQLVEYASGFLSAQDQTLDLGPSIRSPLGDRRLAKLRAPTQLQPGMEGRKTSGIDVEKIERIKASTHEALTKRLDLAASRDRSDPLKAEELQKEVQMVVNELITEEAVGSAEEVAQLRQEVIDEALGYGPIEDLLRDPDVTEIMANGPDHIYVERGGRLQLSSKRFTNERQLRLVIERMIAPIGRRIDESTPMVDGRLPDGSRINAIIEPLAISGATLTIRRFGTERLHISNLLEKRSLVPGMVDFLRACVEGRLNIVVSGGTGSGKTTLLNILSSFIPESDRIITIEDAAELKMEQDHVVRHEARPPNLEGRGEIR